MSSSSLEKMEDANPMDATTDNSHFGSGNVDSPEARFTEFCKVFFFYPFAPYYQCYLIFL